MPYAFIYGIRKKERERVSKMMNKTMQNAVRRVKNEANRKIAYSLPVVNKDMVKNDKDVKKFFESLKK